MASLSQLSPLSSILPLRPHVPPVGLLDPSWPRCDAAFTLIGSLVRRGSMIGYYVSVRGLYLDSFSWDADTLYIAEQDARRLQFTTTKI